MECADSSDSSSSSHDSSSERLLGSDRADSNSGSAADGEGGAGTDEAEAAVGECRVELLLTRRTGRGSTTEGEEAANDELIANRE